MKCGTGKKENGLSQFDTETTVRENAGFRAGHVSDAWNIGDNPNGGYLVSMAMNAILEAVPHPDPVSVTSHFLRPGLANAACVIRVEVIRTGRTLSSVQATLIQDEKARVVVLAALADLEQRAGVEAEITLPAPDIPDPEACVPRTEALQGIRLPILSRLDIRLHPELAVPGGVDCAEMSGHIRFADGRDPDPRALLLFADAFPPSPLSLLGVIGWVPTLELTVHVRRRPAPGWILARFQTDDLQNGRMIETGSLWDSRGALVARSRQLGLVMQRD